MIKIAGAVIESHGPEWAWGWDDPTHGPLRFLAADEEEARMLAHRAGGNVYVREVFETAWADAPS